MSVFEKNLKAIRQGFPELYDRINSLSDADKKDERIAGIEARPSKFSTTSAVILEMSDGGFFRLNSEYDPGHEAKVWMDGQEKPEASYYLIFGLGNGAFAGEIINRIGTDKPVLIYEPSKELFLWALDKYDLSCFFTTKIRVIVDGINEDLFMAVMETMITYENYNDYQIYMTPRMEDAFPDSRERFVKHFAADGIGWIEGNIATERSVLHISPYSLLSNIRYLQGNIVVPYLKDTMPKDVPVLLIGAAPSLAGEIETIKKYRDKVYIFAADSSCSYLLENDIVPDAFMSVEPDRPMELFRNDRIREIPLVAKMDTSYKVLDWQHSTKIFGYDDNRFVKDYYKKYNVPMSEYRYGGNTMTALFAICDEIGVRTVMLVGQDMCFDSEGNTHVDDTRSDTIEKSGSFYCENNEGKTVKTRYDWFTFLRWYESAIYDCSMKQVINTSLKGAKVEGTVVMPLKEAIEKYGREHISFDEVLEKTKRACSDGVIPDMKSEYEGWKKELEEIGTVVAADPRDKRIKEKMIYGILQKYEIVNSKDDFALSQKDGIERLLEYIGEIAG